MDTIAREMLDRLAMALATGSGTLPEMHKWLEKNTSSPLNSDQPWSFAEHEYQIGIISSPARRKAVQKCSQVGMTEIALRIALAVTAMMNDVRVVYTGPTSNFMAKLVKDRANGIIQQSRLLRNALDPDINTNEQKKLGRSLIYFSGAFKPSNAISIPATFLLSDEVDFSNPVVLSSFNSRLRHAPGLDEFGNRGYNWKFSTPTANGLGINKDFVDGSQSYFSVQCPCCHKQQVLNFMQDVVIPGFNEPMNKFSKEALSLPGIDLKAAFVQCPSCHGVITPEAFLDASTRGWVKTHEGRAIDSFQVYPWDVYSYNPLLSVLKQVGDYRRVSDYWNNVVGVPFDDASNSFMAECSQSHPDVRYTLPEAGASGCFSGLDMGKICWYVVVKPNPLTGTDDVIYIERIPESGDNTVLQRALYLNKCFGVVRGVIDAAPEHQIALSYTKGGFYEQNWKSVYLRKPSKGMVGNIKLHPEDNNTVNVWRTGAFDSLSKAVNKRRIRFFSGNEEELSLLREHLSVLRRTEHQADTGEVVARWDCPEGKDDHYAHALNYAMCAREMVANEYLTVKSVAALPMMATARMKS